MNRYFRNAAVLGILLSLYGTVTAGAKVREGQQSATATVTVRTYTYARVPDSVLKSAQRTAACIFANAGVELKWMACPTTEAERPKYPECRKPMGDHDLVLRLMSKAPAAYAKQQHVSGAALLPANGGPGHFASVFFDRVEQMTWKRLKGATEGVFANQLSPGMCTATTLGMVMAHELGHLLLGAHSHSKRGIMQASWGRRDIEQSLLGRQSFTPGQGKRIRANLEAAGCN